MKKINLVCAAIVVLTFSLTNGVSFAAEEYTSPWKRYKPKDYVVAGLSSAAGKIIFHNGGHHLAAKLTDTPIQWFSPDFPDPRPRWYVGPTTDMGALRTIALSGFFTQTAATEVTYHYVRDKRVTEGLAVWEIADCFTYVIRHELEEDGYCDLALYESAGGKHVRLIEGLLLARAGYLSYRLVTGKDLFKELFFPKELGFSDKLTDKITPSIIPLRDGAMLSFTFSLN